MKYSAARVCYKVDAQFTDLTDILYQFDREYTSLVSTSDFSFACI